MTRRLAGVALAVLAAVSLLAAPPAVSEVAAATPGLTIVSDARYDVQPAQHRIHVTLDMTLVNHLKDSTTKRYFFDRAFLSVLPGASDFKLTAGSAAGRVKVSKTTSTYTLLQIDLAARIYSGKSAAYRLVFDLVDRGGAATRDVRVGGSLVSFPVWAFATDATPGSSVRVVFPAGYSVEVQSGDIPAPTTAPDGTIVLQTAKLDAPLTFYAYVVGDQPATYVERKTTTTVGGTPIDLTIQSWADDTPWSDRVGGLVTRALPLLSERIGLAWPRQGGLTVHEAISRSTGGYAGLFDPSLGQIDVAYYADDFVVLHESAHAWFNGGLLADRWANEAFASYYGLEVASALKVAATGDVLTPELEKARIPLNAWGAVGSGSKATEDYAYAATLALAHAIADRAGPEGLRAVWAQAAGRIGAYQPSPAGGGAASGVGGSDAPPELVDGPPDWRGLLDLLEADTSASYDDLWRTWVARDSDLPLLDARREARTRYDAVVAAAGDWRIPRPVRDAMRAWQFDQADGLLTAASAILDQRTAIANGAAAAGLTAPDTLRTAFESPDGFARATLEATAELEAIDRYEAAVAARRPATDLVGTVGLWGTTPDADLEHARTLFASADLPGSASASGAALAAWSGAEDLGRGRLVSIGLLVLSLVLAVVLLGVWFRGRGRRARSVASMAAAATTPDPYATLAATPDPVDPVEAGDAGAGGVEPNRWG